MHDAFFPWAGNGSIPLRLLTERHLMVLDRAPSVPNPCYNQTVQFIGWCLHVHVSLHVWHSVCPLSYFLVACVAVCLSYAFFSNCMCWLSYSLSFMHVWNVSVCCLTQHSDNNHLLLCDSHKQRLQNLWWFCFNNVF